MENPTGSYKFGTFDENQTELQRLAHQAEVAGFVDKAIWRLSGLTPNMTVLDLACGSGNVTCKLASFLDQGRVVGVDASDQLLAEAKKRQEREHVSNLRFQSGNVYALDMDSDMFDYVYVRLLFQHLEHPLKALDSIKRVMKPGGILCVVDVDDDWLMLEPEPKSFKAFNQTAAGGQAARGGDRHVGRKLPGYFHKAGFSGVRMDLLSLSSFDIGLKDFLDITTRFKLEQIPKAQRTEAEAQLEDIYGVLEAPFGWGTVGAFVTVGRK